MTLDMTTLTIMRKLPREVDPVVYHMMTEDPGEVAYSSIGGLADQIRDLREVRHVFLSFEYLATSQLWLLLSIGLIHC